MFLFSSPTSSSNRSRCQVFGGEGNYNILDETIAKLIKIHKDKKTLDEKPMKCALERDRHGPLFFPGKVLADGPGKRLFIADSTHHRIVITDMAGKKLDSDSNRAPHRTGTDFGKKNGDTDADWDSHEHSQKRRDQRAGDGCEPSEFLRDRIPDLGPDKRQAKGPDRWPSTRDECPANAGEQRQDEECADERETVKDPINAIRAAHSRGVWR